MKYYKRYSGVPFSSLTVFAITLTADGKNPLLNLPQCVVRLWSVMAQVVLSVPPDETSVIQPPGEGLYFVLAEGCLPPLDWGAFLSLLLVKKRI